MFTIARNEFTLNRQIQRAKQRKEKMTEINEQFWAEYEKWQDDIEDLEIQEDDEWNAYIQDIYERESKND